MNRMNSQGFRSLDSRITWEESHPTRNTLNGLDQKLESWETWVRSLGWEDSPGKENGYPLQDSGLENSMDRIVHGVKKRRT